MFLRSVVSSEVRELKTNLWGKGEEKEIAN